MTQKREKELPEIRLRCLNGHPAPTPVAEGWRRFLQFPAAARSGFWDVLDPAIKDPANPRNMQRVQDFCNDHGLEKEEALAAVQSCDFLLRQAIVLNLTKQEFSQDLSALSEDRLEEAEIISSHYDSVKTELRNAIIQMSLADHGKVLVGMDWRVDNITASDRGTQLDTSVVFLTLRYRDGDRLGRITLQLTPEALNQLKQFTDRLGSPP